MKGTSHDTLGLTTTFGVVLLSYYFSVPTWAYGAMASGAFTGTLWMSPDLDLKQSLPTKRWGPLKGLWKCYAKKMKHRGLSHMPIFGNLHRIWYLLTRCCCIPLVLLVWAQIVFPWITIHLLMFVSGIEIYCISHILSDHLYSFLKKWGLIRS
jgi:uncharacterized metal-binding protein